MSILFPTELHKDLVIMDIAGFEIPLNIIKDNDDVITQARDKMITENMI